MTDDRIDELEERIDTLEDTVRTARRDHALALQRISTLEDENERLREKQAQHDAQLDPAVESKSYESLSTEEKVAHVRSELIAKARARRNMGNDALAKLTYTEVQELFGGKASTRHAYDLMKWAGSADGYQYVEPSGRKKPNYVMVRLDEAETAEPASLVVRRNNTSEGEGGL